MDKPVAIGIDLGTSTSEIAVFQHGEPVVIPDPYTRSPIVPSLVAMDKRGRWRIGEEARSWVDIPGYGVREVKRLMGTDQTVTIQGQSYRPEEISAMILQKLKQNAEVSLGTEISEVVISVPANFPDAARQATLNAGKIVGLRVLKVINEPTAAALAFGIRHLDTEAQLVVFDFGGGTLDISVLEMIDGVLDVRSSFGDPMLGGKDIDEALKGVVMQKFNAQFPNAVFSSQAEEQIKAAVERAKIELSSSRYADIRIPAAARYKNDVVDLEVEVSREELNQAIAPLLDKARRCVEQALSAGKVRPDSVDTILLVGGSTYIPAVRDMVADMFGKQPSHGVHPDLAVALGACVAAAVELNLVDAEQGLVYTDSIPYGLGIQVLQEEGGRIFVAYSPLIQPNTPIPYVTKQQYSLLHPDQREVEIHLFQDHTGKARRIEEAVDTGIVGRIVDVPPALYGSPHPVEVEFAYDRDGIARIRATIPGVNKSVEISYDHHAARMSEAELIASRERLARLIEQIESIQPVVDPLELWKEHPDSKQYAPLIERAESLVRQDPVRHAKVHEALEKLKQALVDGDDARISRASDALVSLLMETQ